LEQLQQADALRFPELKLPKTIQDAIFLLRRLGGRRLWVDQLYILQDDEAVKSVKLGAIAAIYRNAYATIAAAQGEHVDKGLHGVQTVPRILWPCGRHEDHKAFEWWHSLHLSPTAEIWRWHARLVALYNIRRLSREEDALDVFEGVLLRGSFGA